MTIGVRVTVEERDVLKRAAGFEPLAAFVRRMALEAVQKPKKR